MLREPTSWDGNKKSKEASLDMERKKQLALELYQALDLTNQLFDGWAKGSWNEISGFSPVKCYDDHIK